MWKQRQTNRIDFTWITGGTWWPLSSIRRSIHLFTTIVLWWIFEDINDNWPLLIDNLSTHVYVLWFNFVNWRLRSFLFTMCKIICAPGVCWYSISFLYDVHKTYNIRRYILVVLLMEVRIAPFNHQCNNLWYLIISWRYFYGLS